MDDLDIDRDGEKTTFMTAEQRRQHQQAAVMQMSFYETSVGPHLKDTDDDDD
jgi:hypothetical protein